MSVLTKITSYREKLCLLQILTVKFVSKHSIKVAVLGANGKTGRPLSLMLKQCSQLKEIALFDEVSTSGLAAELDQVDTTSIVTSQSGSGALPATLKGADIVVMMAGKKSDGDAFEENAPIVAEISEHCAEICPNALITVVTSPINSFVPLVTEIYRRVNKVVDFNRIFGFITADTLRASCFAAEILSIPAEKIAVPVIGGTGPQTSIPVLNNLPLGTEEAVRVTSATREAAQKQNPLSSAYAISRFVNALAQALSGSRDVIECAYVHSYLFSNSPSTYLATPLQIGSSGMEKNLGLPTLSQYESSLLETALPTLHKDIEKGLAFAQEYTLKQ